MLLQGWLLWPLKGLNLKAEVAAFLVALFLGGGSGMWKSIFVHTVSYCRRFLL